MQKVRKLNVLAHIQHHFEDAAQGGKAWNTLRVFAICLRVNERPTFQERQHINAPQHVKSGDLESTEFQVCLAQPLARDLNSSTH